MKIEIHDAQDAEPKFLGEVLSRLCFHQNINTVDLYVNKRNTDGRRNPLGWIEYLAVLKYMDGGKLTIGCLQRGLGEPTEFHT